MHPFFSVTLFTGQQLVLEAVQRWLTRPCADEAALRQRRLGLKGLIRWVGAAGTHAGQGGGSWWWWCDGLPAAPGAGI